MEQKDHEKDDGLLGSVLGGILGFFGIQSEEQKKAEIIQKGVELQEIQESIAILNTTILQLKNKEKELDEKGKLMRTQREEKQRKAYLKANQKRRILLKFIFLGIFFAVGLTIPLFFFKIIIINNTSEWLFVLLIFSLVMLALMASLPKEKKFYLEPSRAMKKKTSFRNIKKFFQIY